METKCGRAELTDFVPASAYLSTRLQTELLSESSASVLSLTAEKRLIMIMTLTLVSELK